MKPVLEVENLTFGFDSARPILRGISFSVLEAEPMGVAGANGAGKSTLLACLLGLYKASGTVRFFGEPLCKRTLERIGVVFQNPEDQLFMPSLLEDLTLPLVNRRVPAGLARERALAALEGVGLLACTHRAASQLSLGERKRASIAAALVGSPDLLLLDEPTAELDGRAVRELTGVLRPLAMSRVITGHHLDFLRDATRRLLVLADGQILAQGPTEQLLSDRGLLERAGLI